MDWLEIAPAERIGALVEMNQPGVWIGTIRYSGAGRHRRGGLARSAVFKPKWAGNRWVNHWTINGKEFPKTGPIRVKTGLRYRLAFDNQSSDAHPVHLHRHSFELVSIAGKPSAGIMKDVVMCPPRQKVEVQFVADNPGPTLFRCHQQLHMDFGFMAMVEYEGYKAESMPGM